MELKASAELIRGSHADVPVLVLLIKRPMVPYNRADNTRRVTPITRIVLFMLTPESRPLADVMSMIRITVGRRPGR